MRIGIIGSMQFTEMMFSVRDGLRKLGHDAYVTSLADPFVGKSDEEKEKIMKIRHSELLKIKDFQAQKSTILVSPT